MPWNTRDTMSLREEFIALARHPSANIRALCRNYGITPQTGYKWLRRIAQEGETGLKEKSRKTASSPKQTHPALEAEVVMLRKAHPGWGGHKISYMLDQRISPSTVTSVLHRHGLISPQASTAATHWKRFEHAAPNDLWQMDFKGHFQTGQGTCHPLTVIYDHSRFNLAIQACAHQRAPLVQEHLTEVFSRYGMTFRINVDNGAPWPYESQFRFKKQSFRIAKSLAGHIVALRPSTKGADHFDVFFCHHKLRTIDFTKPDGRR
ncbi:hypothetical protein LK03_20195 [Pseudomonas cremoricolorata]|uniref:Integrase catalytic domain-containing protein n=1 Tax=Pseudomonas cremoricolorata TaxID=157783 RepID=A0A089WXS7_9PSED|nr:hypothetical protein LK03_20195 [Pseudomonas cremoricolorata]